MDASFGGDQYSYGSNSYPDFGRNQYGENRYLSPENAGLMAAYGSGSNLRCANRDPLNLPRSYDQRMGINYGSVEDRRDFVLSAGPCQSAYTNGRVNDKGKRGSFLNIGGAGEEYRKNERKEGFRIHNGAIKLSFDEFVLVFIFIVLIFASIYCVKALHELKQIVKTLEFKR